MATTPIPANCAAVTQQLLEESGRLATPMYVRAARSRPIIRLQSPTNGMWQHGMGHTVSAVTFERSFPALTGDGWTTVAPSDGDSVNACIPPSETVSFGETSRSYSPKQYSVNTQRWCIRDINFGWQFQEFMGNVTQALGIITEWVWYRRYTQDYFDNAGHHLTLNPTAGVQDSSVGYNTSNLATARLTQSVLDNIYLNLYREAGDRSSGFDKDTMSPVFTLITSQEASRHVIIDNPDIRQDVRWGISGKGYNDPSVNPLVPGVPTQRRIYGNFFHEIDPYPRRFLFNGSVYVEVPPFLQSTTTKGFKWELNAAWLTAPFEESIVFHEQCYQELMYMPNFTPAAGWNFTPQNWMGQFSPRNIPSDTCNQDGDIIYMRALFGAAARPVNPLVGWTILHARCGFANDLNLCYGYPSS